MKCSERHKDHVGSVERPPGRCSNLLDHDRRLVAHENGVSLQPRSTQNTCVFITSPHKEVEIKFLEIMKSDITLQGTIRLSLLTGFCELYVEVECLYLLYVRLYTGE